MTRREFFHLLARLSGLIALPTAARAAPARPRLIQCCPLAGFQHHEGEELWPFLTVGDSLELRREAGNRHDGNAIRIDWLGRRLGYLPRQHNATTARLLDQGRVLQARIGHLQEASNPWQRVTLEIWMIG